MGVLNSKNRIAWSTACLVPAVMIVSAASAMPGDIVVQPKAGAPLPGLTPEQLDRFEQGLERFEHTFTVEEGLGPNFNQNSCASCHAVPAVGGSGSITVTRFGFVDQKTGEFDPLEKLGGSLLQAEAIALDGFPTDHCLEVVPDAASFDIQRITNSALGLGLIEALPDSVIEDNETNSATGRIHWVPALEDEPGSPLRAGRMGWKAQLATVLSFSADASFMEMGITNSILPDPTPVYPNGDEALYLECNQVADPNDQPDKEGFAFIDRVTDFQRFASPPPQTPQSGMSGEATFMQIGCGSCHIPSYTTPDDPTIEDALRNQTFKPYTDFLLHNMGLLGDGIEQGDAGQLEIRAPALWGLLHRDPLLHDGRVGGGTFESRVIAAIDWHDVFGSAARDEAQAFDALSQPEKDQVVAFLASLGQLEFDADLDNAITDDDFNAFVGCYTGPRGAYTPDDPCSIHDVNQDGAVDELDFGAFLSVYEGMQEDCDLWLALDAGVGKGIDVPVPAECLGDPCPSDLNGDDIVNVFDLLAVLSAWGDCVDCPEDLNGDDVVNVFDLLQVLGAWGACP